MPKKVAVIGLGRFGESPCNGFMAPGSEVPAIDIDEESVNRVAVVPQAVIADTTREDGVRELDLANCDRICGHR